jgi:cytochrome c553
MHNSLDGAAMATNSGLVRFQAGPYLLKASDASSTCLNCHERAGDTGPTSYHISTADPDMPIGAPPIQLSPGGDFGWLKKTYNWMGETPQTSPGERHGHNVIAFDYGYTQDTTHVVAPGGGTFQYPSDQLGCISCHDPHGKYRRNKDTTITTTGMPIAGSGSYSTSADPGDTTAVGAYRLLGGVGYHPKSLPGNYAFINSPFFAAAPGDYNRSEAVTDVRVAYGQGVSLWCSNCHSNMHTSAVDPSAHPADNVLSPDVLSRYNSYVKTGDVSGTQATSYLSLVPFQTGDSADMITLRDAVTTTAGPITGDKVMCLSCHRAHASGWNGITRFPLGVTFMTVDEGTGNPVYPSPALNPIEAMGRSTAEYQVALYDRPATRWSTYQRVLCNKCHVQE